MPRGSPQLELQGLPHFCQRPGFGVRSPISPRLPTPQSQIYLVDENFVQRMQAQMNVHQQQDKQMPNLQRQRRQSWTAWLAQCHVDRDQARYQAYQDGGITMTPLGRESRLSISHVSRLISKGKKGKWKT